MSNEVSLTGWVFHYKLDVLAEKSAKLGAGLSATAAIYLAVRGFKYSSVPFFLSSGLCWVAAVSLARARERLCHD